MASFISILSEANVLALISSQNLSSIRDLSKLLRASAGPLVGTLDGTIQN